MRSRRSNSDAFDRLLACISYTRSIISILYVAPQSCRVIVLCVLACGHPYGRKGLNNSNVYVRESVSNVVVVVVVVPFGEKLIDLAFDVRLTYSHIVKCVPDDRCSKQFMRAQIVVAEFRKRKSRSDEPREAERNCVLRFAFYRCNSRLAFVHHRSRALRSFAYQVHSLGVCVQKFKYSACCLRTRRILHTRRVTHCICSWSASETRYRNRIRTAPHSGPILISSLNSVQFNGLRPNCLCSSVCLCAHGGYLGSYPVSLVSAFA